MPAGRSRRCWRKASRAPWAAAKTMEPVRPLRGQGGTSYQVMFKAPAGDGQPWRRVLRRANSEGEAGENLGQAEAAVDAERETPASADVRASRTIRALRYAYLDDSRQRNKHPPHGHRCGRPDPPTSARSNSARDGAGRTEPSALPIPARAVASGGGMRAPERNRALAPHCVPLHAHAADGDRDQCASARQGSPGHTAPCARSIARDRRIDVIRSCCGEGARGR